MFIFERIEDGKKSLWNYLAFSIVWKNQTAIVNLQSDVADEVDIAFQFQVSFDKFETP